MARVYVGESGGMRFMARDRVQADVLARDLAMLTGEPVEVFEAEHEPGAGSGRSPVAASGTTTVGQSVAVVQRTRAERPKGRSGSGVET